MAAEPFKRISIRDYLDGMFGRVREQFRDDGRCMSLADVGRALAVLQGWAAEHGDLPELPYQAEERLG